MKTGKILILTDEFPPVTGGAGTYSYELAIGIAGSGKSVTVITRSTGTAASIKAIDLVLKIRFAVEVLRYSTFWKFFFVQFPWQIKSLLQDKSFLDYDLIIAADSRMVRYLTLLNDEKVLAKSLLIFHGGEVKTFIIKPNLQVRLSGISRRFASVLQKSIGSVCVSRALRNQFIGQLPDLENKFHVVAHGIDVDSFKPLTFDEKISTRENYGYRQNEKIIISVSRLVQGKGQDKIISIFDDLAKKISGLKLLIAGDGPMLAELQAQASKLVSKNAVRFLGKVPRNELNKYLGIADVFVLLSTLDEGFGIVFLEANACGLPVIGWASGGVVDAIHNNINGFILPNGDLIGVRDRLIELLNDDDQREILSDSAREYAVANHSNLRMARDTLSLAGITG